MPLRASFVHWHAFKNIGELGSHISQSLQWIFIKLPVSLDSVLIIDLTSHNFVLITKTLKIAILRDIGKREGVKPRANGRNIVGCYMLLRVFGSCCAEFETGQTFEPTIPNISFVP